MDKKFKSILILLGVWIVVSYPVFVSFSFAGNRVSPAQSGNSRASLFMDMFSSEPVVMPEEIVPLPELIQNMIDNLPMDTQAAEKLKDDIAYWATKQRNRLTWWRVHTMSDN